MAFGHGVSGKWLRFVLELYGSGMLDRDHTGVYLNRSAISCPSVIKRDDLTIRIFERRLLFSLHGPLIWDILPLWREECLGCGRLLRRDLLRRDGYFGGISLDLPILLRTLLLACDLLAVFVIPASLYWADCRLLDCLLLRWRFCCDILYVLPMARGGSSQFGKLHYLSCCVCSGRLRCVSHQRRLGTQRHWFIQTIGPDQRLHASSLCDCAGRC